MYRITKLFLFVFLWVGILISTGCFEQTNTLENETIVNVNPDKTGDPWLAGGSTVPEIISSSQFLTLEMMSTKDAPLPEKLDNSQKQYFRPIYAQKHGSCAQASGVGYGFTYEWNAVRGTDASLEKNQFPTHYTYNFLNAGEDGGSLAEEGYQIIEENGIPNVVAYGGMAEGGLRRWISGYDMYYNAMRNKIKSRYIIQVRDEEGLETLKRWLYDHGNGFENGGIAVFAADVNAVDYRRLAAGTPHEGKSIVVKWGDSAPHGMTYVGYDDTIRFDINGDGKFTNHIDITGDGVVDLADWEIGALKVANSWGTSWRDDGFSYMMYRLLSPKVKDGAFSSVDVVEVHKDYTPRMTLKVKLYHNKRSRMKITTGVSQDVASTVMDFTKEFYQFKNMGGEYPVQGINNDPLEFGLDITELYEKIDASKPAKFFLNVDADYSMSGDNGVLYSYSLIDYTQGGREYTGRNSSVIIEGKNALTIVRDPSGDTTKTEKRVYYYSENNSRTSLFYKNDEGKFIEAPGKGMDIDLNNNKDSGWFVIEFYDNDETGLYFQNEKGYTDDNHGSFYHTTFEETWIKDGIIYSDKPETDSYSAELNFLNDSDGTLLENEVNISVTRKATSNSFLQKLKIRDGRILIDGLINGEYEVEATASSYVFDNYISEKKWSFIIENSDVSQNQYLEYANGGATIDFKMDRYYYPSPLDGAELTVYRNDDFFKTDYVQTLGYYYMYNLDNLTNGEYRVVLNREHSGKFFYGDAVFEIDEGYANLKALKVTEIEGEKGAASIHFTIDGAENSKALFGKSIYLYKGDTLVDTYEIEESISYDIAQSKTSPLDYGTYRVVLSSVDELVSYNGEVEFTLNEKNRFASHIMRVKESRSGYESVFENLYYRGTTNSWSTQTMELVDDYTWETTVTVDSPGELFKFDAAGDWSLNFGDNNSDLALEQDGNNIAFPDVPGRYLVRVYDNTKSYRIIGLDVEKRGVAHISSPHPDVHGFPMTLYRDGSVFKTFSMPLGSNETTLEDLPPGSYIIKLDKTHSGIHYYGKSEFVIDEYNLEVSIVVDVTETVTNVFNSSYPHIYFRGTTNSWGIDEMRLIDDYTREITITTDSSFQFKFDVYGDWSQNFGDTNGDRYFEEGGSDISVTEGAGTYTITLYEIMGRYKITKESSPDSFNQIYDTVYFRGTANGFAATEMTLVADYTWEIVIRFKHSDNERFKFDIYGDWSLNYGDNNGDNYADQSGADIQVEPGLEVKITFNDKTKKYTVKYL
jgi:hypothetical protein